MQSSFGLRRLLARRIDCPGTIGPVDAFACRREGADGSFASLRADLRHQQALGERGARGSLALRLAGQWASQPLVSSEQYSIGGAETVRGYLESEGSGDHGLLAGLEWRSTNFARSLGLASPGSAPAPGPSPAALGDLEDLTVLAFAEAARVRILRPGAGQAARIPLAGAGIGLRLRSRERITAEVDIAWPLKATRQTHEADARVHVRLATQF
jgi:hemolysin activation/secretion protein